MADTDVPESSIAEELNRIAHHCDEHNYDRAAEIARRLLRRHPSSAEAHEAMGDIAAARGNHDEAVEWYELSLRLESNHRVVSKLGEQRGMIAANQAAPPETEELEEEERSRKHYRIIAAIAGGAVLLVFILILVAALRREPSSQEPTAAQSQARPAATRWRQSDRSSEGRGQSPAASGRSRATPSGTASPSQGKPAPTWAPAEQPEGNLPPVHITRDIDAPLSEEDRRLLHALSALTWPSGDKVSGSLNAMVDPFTGYGFVTLMLPRSIKPAHWTNTAITMSYRIAVAAMKHNASLRSLTVRIIAPVNVDDEEVVMTLFRGNTNREAIERFLDDGAQPDLREIWEKIFATTWWNPSASEPSPPR